MNKPGPMAIRVEQHVGLEPTHAAWKAAGLPITQVLHNDSAPAGLRVHPTVLLTKIAAGSYPDHSNVSIANRVSLAERRGLEPLRRCRRPWLSGPAPYLLGQRSMWRRLEDSNPHALADNGFLDRRNSHSASSRRICRLFRLSRLVFMASTSVDSEPLLWRTMVGSNHRHPG